MKNYGNTKVAKSFHVLIIDDEESVAQTLQAMCVKCGIEASYVCEHQAFLSLFVTLKPDVVIIDLKMPGMDGVQLMRELAKTAINTDIIISSGTGMPVLSAAKRVAERLGLSIMGTLQKPFSLDDINQHLSKLKVISINDKLPEAQKVEIANNANLNMLDELKKAIKHRHIEVYFQPKVQCATGTLIGAEALARWRHPTLGMVSPEVFVALCEVHGLIDMLTEQVVERSFEWLASLNDPTYIASKFGNLDSLHLSINVSAQSLSNEFLFSKIRAYSEKFNIRTEKIILEVTESYAMNDEGPALEYLTRLRLMGFELSIDDFGTGYSSMVQLVKIPFSELKIDKTFILDLDKNPQSLAVAKSVCDMGKSLGMRVVAEGVESQEILGLLKKIKCDIAQGFFIGKPMSANDFALWYQQREEKREAARVVSLNALALLDTPPESRYDRITRIAKRVFGVPISLVSLVDSERQWFKSSDGLDVRQTEREIAFCSRAIQQDEPFVVEDSLETPEFKDNPLVTDSPNIRFYAGQPLYLDDGHKLGTLCILDDRPRLFSESDKTLLAELAQLVKNELSHAHNLDVLDERIGILPRGAYHQQSKSMVEVCRKLHLPVYAISVRLMNLGSISREYDEQTCERLLRELGQLLSPYCEVTDLVGQRTYSEVIALVIAPDKNEKKDVCKRIHNSVLEWNNNKKAQQIKLDVEIGTADVPFTSEGHVDELIDKNWMLYSAVINE